jgi:hypothetical protein
MRALCALTWLCALLLSAPALALPEETWLIAVGNNRGDPGEVELLYAERDAREVAAVLQEQGAVASDRVRLLLADDAVTVRRALFAVNEVIRARVQAGVQHTALVVFYSGHADAEALHLRGGRLPFEELRALVAGSAASMRLLIVDACRAGAVTRVKGVRPAPEFSLRLNDRLQAEGLAILTSSASGEWSQESDRLRASFFSHHLVTGLRGAADSNGDGRVTLAEAYAYTYAQTLRSSGQTLNLQHPTYAYDIKGSGDVVVTMLRDAGRGAGQLRLPDAGGYLISEEREGGVVVAELAAARPGARIFLPRGRYFVQQRGSEEYREFQVLLGSGQEIDLAQRPYRSVRYDRLLRKGGGTRPLRHGLSVMVGARGELLAGEGPMPQPVLGYHVDLAPLTLGLRVRGSSIASEAMGGGAGRRHHEVMAGLMVQRFVDLPWFSLAFWLSVEAGYHGQTFDDAQRPRHAAGVGFSGLVALERHLRYGLAARLEGGPMVHVLPRAEADNGAQVGAELDTRITWWVAGGMLWR